MENEYRIDPTIAYDVVELPSRGIHYTNKKKSVRVSYLTASDEDILAAPNLVQSKSTIDELLRRKVLDKDLPIEEYAEEDKEAILIFLRNTAWGAEYKLTLTDPKPLKDNNGNETDGRFTQMIDLSTIKLKDFKLVEDSNGEYSYYLEKSKVDITFKFLTRLQEIELDKIKDSWNGNGVPPVRTKELEMMIKSVKGIKDPMQIRSFIVDKMPIKDSQDFRKFVNENKPGLDLLQEIVAPSGEVISIQVGFGVEFFRPFYGL
jgi:hypothetical protein